MYRSQRLALKYFAVAMGLFGVMTIAGLLSAVYYVEPSFLFGKLDFSVAKTLHIDTVIIWLLMGFMGAVYWFLPEELGRETQGIRLGEIMLYVLTAAVVIVALVFVFVQYGPSEERTLWLIT